VDDAVRFRSRLASMLASSLSSHTIASAHSGIGEQMSRKWVGGDGFVVRHDVLVWVGA
jgi:hypothetical protein